MRYHGDRQKLNSSICIFVSANVCVSVIWSHILLLTVCAVWICCSACSNTFRVIPLAQRVIIQRATPFYKLIGEQRTREQIGVAAPGDTLLSFATVLIPTEIGHHQLFYIVRDREEAWLEASFTQTGLAQTSSGGAMDNANALTEYDTVVRVCDTKFTMPIEYDSLVWHRALEYVSKHSSDAVQYATAQLIQTSKRGRLPGSVSFTVRRMPLSAEMVQYSVRANESTSDIHARKCAFFMQTGRDERYYHGVNNMRKE